YPSGNFSWHHLWFLLYILVYSLLFIPLFFWVRKGRLNVNGLTKWMIVVMPILWFGTGECLLVPLFPKTHAFYNDWYAHFMYISIFLIGFFIECAENIQHKVKDFRTVTFILAIITATLLYSLFWIGNAGFAYVGKSAYHYLVAANRWLWIL